MTRTCCVDSRVPTLRVSVIILYNRLVLPRGHAANRDQILRPGASTACVVVCAVPTLLLLTHFQRICNYCSSLNCRNEWEDKSQRSSGGNLGEFPGLPHSNATLRVHMQTTTHSPSYSQIYSRNSINFLAFSLHVEDKIHQLRELRSKSELLVE